MSIPTSPEVFVELNKALALAEESTLLHMMQHFKMEKIERRVKAENILLDKTDFAAVGGKMRGIGIQMMKQLFAIMERIYKLGGQVKAPFKIGGIGNTMKEFFELGYANATSRLEVLRKLIKLCDDIGDIETSEMARGLYRATEEHLLFFEEYKKLDMKEPKGPEDVEDQITHTKVYDDAYFKLLTEACQAELAAIFTYTTQRARIKLIHLREKTSTLETITASNKGEVVAAMLHKICLEEMKHLELISERIFKLGGDVSDLTPYPPVEIGESIDDYLRSGKIHEDVAIVLYRKIINVAQEKGDIVTKRMFETILEEEDGHYFAFDEFF